MLSLLGHFDVNCRAKLVPEFCSRGYNIERTFNFLSTELTVKRSQKFDYSCFHLFGDSNRWQFCRSMRDRTNACVPRDVSCDKRGKFCKHLKGFKTKINRMNEENFAAFFVLLAFIELSCTVTSLTGETNSNIKGKQEHSHSNKTERLYEVFC